MKKAKRANTICFRLDPEEYERIEHAQVLSTDRSISEYVRRAVFERVERERIALAVKRGEQLSPDDLAASAAVFDPTSEVR